MDHLCSKMDETRAVHSKYMISYGTKMERLDLKVKGFNNQTDLMISAN